MDINKFKQKPILGILRGISGTNLEPLIETILSSGLETIEITMNTPNAKILIRQAVKISRGRLTIGAGTVLDKYSLKNALHAGATFIVTPILNKKIAAACVKNKIPFFPGALTPLEICNAWDAGATMVKIFPSGFFGPAYFKEIKGPFDRIELLACGGVTPENMTDFLANGASAVAFGSSVFKKEWLANNNFSAVKKAIGNFTQTYEKRKDA